MEFYANKGKHAILFISMCCRVEITKIHHVCMMDLLLKFNILTFIATEQIKDLVVV